MPARLGTAGVARSGLYPGRLLGGTEHVNPERTGLQRSTTASGEAQCPGKGPAALRRVQALRDGVHRGPPTGEPPPWVRDQNPGPDDDTQQIVDRSALPAPHTGAYRDRR